MTRKKWTTPDQENWLRARCEAFAKAEVNNERKAFYKELLKCWLEKWPNPDPSLEQIQEAGGEEQAIKKNL